jgi:hypothetical protein
MWILSVLPDFVLHLILIAGILGTVVGFVLGFIPLVSKYKLPIQICSVLILSLGVYLEGGLADKQEWLLKVKEVEAKLAKAEAQAAVENVKIVTKVVKKLELVRTRGNDVVQYIDREVVKYDNICPIPIEVIRAHNVAAGDLRLKMEMSLTLKDPK